MIYELHKVITFGGSEELIKAKIAENIEEVVINPQFYKLGLEVLCKIFDKCDVIDSSSILNIINLGYKEYYSKVTLLLPHIKCGKLTEIEHILDSLSFIPIFHEMKRNYEMHFNIMNERKNEYVDINKEGEFDIDWEHEYQKIKRKHEIIEKKISIMKQLQFRIEEEERTIKEEEKEKIDGIIKERDLNAAIDMLKSDPSLIHSDFLHLCAASGWKEGVELVIDIFFLSEEYVNKKNNDGKTPLMCGSQYGHLEIVKYLISKRANTEVKDNKRMTALMIASAKGYLDVVEYLISQGANIEEKDNDGWTSLMRACIKGQLEVVKCLISKGANIIVKNSNGWTSLMAASVKGHLDIVKYLISKGANIKEKNKRGMTALMIASQNGQLEVAQYLVSKGANIKEKNNSGFTVMMYACQNGHLEVVSYLLSNGVYIDEKNNNGSTALMIASGNGHLETVKYLISKGANVEEKNNSGWTALMVASVKGRFDVVEFLNSMPR